MCRFTVITHGPNSAGWQSAVRATSARRGLRCGIRPKHVAVFQLEHLRAAGEFWFMWRVHGPALRGRPFSSVVSPKFGCNQVSLRQFCRSSGVTRFLFGSFAEVHGVPGAPAVNLRPTFPRRSRRWPPSYSSCRLNLLHSQSSSKCRSGPNVTGFSSVLAHPHFSQSSTPKQSGRPYPYP